MRFKAAVFRFAILTISSVCAVQTASAYYDASISRWINRDPLSERGGINLHAFVNNGPLNKIDPVGRVVGGGVIPIGPNIGDCRSDPAEAALGAEDRNFPGVADPYQGGFRHCVGACIVARCAGWFGRVCLWIRALIFEDEDDPNGQMDLEGEDLGKRIAEGNEGCEAGCLEEYPPVAAP